MDNLQLGKGREQSETMYLSPIFTSQLSDET